jgi:TolB-like protein
MCSLRRGEIVRRTSGSPIPVGKHIEIRIIMKPENKSGGTVPFPEEVRGALSQIAASEEFRSSPQLVAFLSFVVEAVLNGDSGRIKAYTIGVEAFGRGSGFDPQADPIVRVEATRLRRTMERYYAGKGVSDPVIIELSRGTYVPGFKYRRGASAITAGESDPGLRRRVLRQMWLLPSAVVALLMVIAFFGPNVQLDWSGSSATPGAPTHGAQSAFPALRPGNGMPTLLVQAFEVIGEPDQHGLFALSLHDRLSDAFSKFDLVNIVWEPMQGGAETGRPPASRLPVDFRFTGSVEYTPGVAHVGFRLVDAADGAVVWSRVFDEPAEARDAHAFEEAIVRELTSTLVQPFGVVYAYERRQAATRGAGDPRYRCLLEAIESFRSFDAKQASGARACLEQFTSLDPTFALGWTYMAALYLRESLYGDGTRPDDLPPLERALRAARRGVELNPASARAHEMLFAALFARHDVAAAFAAGEKALLFNPYDMRIVGAYGVRKIAVGEIDAGMAMLRRASGDGTVVPTVEQFFLFIGSYLKGDMERASFHASQLTNDTFQLGLVARTLMACRNGDYDAMRSDVDRLVALNPVWRQNLRAELGKFFYADAIVDRLAAKLSEAGLSATD